MNKKVFLCILVLLLGILYSSNATQLSELFNRNGEVYLSVSGLTGSSASRNGIYRLNDPAGDIGGSFPHQLLTYKYTKSFAVDIKRVIYSLASPTMNAIDDGYIMYRQVLDGGVTYSEADYGYHTWIHFDHRDDGWQEPGVDKDLTDGSTNLPLFRYVEGGGRRHPISNSGGEWSSFDVIQDNSRCVGTSLPEGYTVDEVLPQDETLTDTKKVVEVSGKNWYGLPNDAWYSSWMTAPATDNGMDKFYIVYHDKYTGSYAMWYLETDQPRGLTSTYGGNPNIYQNLPSKRKFITRTVNASLSRNVLAGCLDGCGGANGSGGAEVPGVYIDIAFMPYGSDSDVRTYLYSRHQNKSDGKLTGAEGHIVTGDVNGVAPAVDTLWVGCSRSSDSNKDYVYLMGTSNIKKWIGDDADISAVSVSNQWDEEGGIIFAYDKLGDKILKFRIENPGTPSARATDTVAIPLHDIPGSSGLLSKIGHSKANVDDIATDGFGYMYLGLTIPSADMSYVVPEEENWDLKRAVLINKFERNDDEYVKEIYVTWNFEPVIYKKSVWKISPTDLNEAPTEIDSSIKVGEKRYTRMYVYKANDVVQSKIMSAHNGNEWQEAHDYLVSNGYFKRKDSFVRTLDDPAPDIPAKLGVLNAPTPPKVHSLCNSDKSYIDLIGPFTEYVYAENGSTRLADAKNDGKLLDDTINSATGVCSNLQSGKLYYYYIDNYPVKVGDEIEDNKVITNQNPNVEPDVDGDYRYSGFVSTIINSSVKFYWKVWCVSEYFPADKKVQGDEVVNDPNQKSIVPCYYSHEIEEEEIEKPDGTIITKYSEGGYAYPAELYTEDVSRDPYVTIFSPNKARYIITCQACYDWHDYGTVMATETYSEWKNSERSTTTGDWALPAKKTSYTSLPDNYKELSYIKEEASANDISASKAELAKALDLLFPASAYSGDASRIAAAKEKIKDEIWKKTEMDTPNHAQYMFVWPVSVDGDFQQIGSGTEDVVALERAIATPTVNVNISSGQYFVPLSDTSPNNGYFCSPANQPTYWRVELDSQAILFADMNDTIGGKKVYEILKNRLLTSAEGGGIGDLDVYSHEKDGGLPSLLFKNQPSDLPDQMRWKNGSVVKAYEMKVDIQTVEDGTTVTRSMQLPAGKYAFGRVKSDSDPKYLETGKQYLFFKLPPGYIHATDPYVATLTISISRELEYDMYIVNNRHLYPPPAGGYPTGTIYNDMLHYYASNPIKMRKPLTITGQAYLMTVDMDPPKLAWSETITGNEGMPNQINGETAKELTSQTIDFKYTDDVPWDKVSITPHSDYDDSNIAHNASLIKPGVYETTKKDNFMPTANPANRGIRLELYLGTRRYDGSNNVISSDTYSTGFGYIASTTSRAYWMTNTGIPDPTSANIVVSQLNDGGKGGETISVSTNATNLNSGTDLWIPFNFANNNPSYSPATFGLYLSDLSGNATYTAMNLILEVKDTIKPVPFGQIREYRDNKTTIFPWAERTASPSSMIDILYEDFVFDSNSIKTTMDALERTYYSANSLEIMPTVPGGATGVNIFSPNNDETWNSQGDINGILTTSGNHLGYKFKALPCAHDSIYSIRSDLTSPGSIIRNLITAEPRTVPPTLHMHDNVEALITAFAVDNSGSTKAKATYKYFNINGDEKTYTVNTDNSISGQTVASASQRIIFREYKDDTIRLPYAVPIVIEAEDDARGYDTYEQSGGYNSAENKFTFKRKAKGASSPNKRILKTILPVFGTTMDTRQLEKYINFDGSK